MRSRVAALDYGSARIGIALSDESKILASPLTVFAAKKKQEETAQALLAFLQEHAKENRYELEKIVVGLPITLKGEVGPQAKEVLSFIEELKKLSEIPFVTWDERLTTSQAEKSLKEFSMNRKKRSKVVDKVAAVIILQTYLESRP
jgi:putative Holliday junction resolvase